MAAVLACGGGAALSHTSAAALWGIAEERAGQIDVSIRRRCKHRRPGIRARSRPCLEARDLTAQDRIPLTSPTRTLLDLATELGETALERAVNEADKRDLVNPETLRSELDEYTGQSGTRALRKLLDQHSFRLSDSALEILFRSLATEAGLPPPLTKARVNGVEVDFFWPELGLVVETDGLRYHRTASTQARDRLRDQAHTAAGMTPLRFTHRQVKYERARVRNVLRQTVHRIRSRQDGI